MNPGSEFAVKKYWHGEENETTKYTVRMLGTKVRVIAECGDNFAHACIPLCISLSFCTVFVAPRAGRPHLKPTFFWRGHQVSLGHVTVANVRTRGRSPIASKAFSVTLRLCLSLSRSLWRCFHYDTVQNFGGRRFLLWLETNKYGLNNTSQIYCMA